MPSTRRAAAVIVAALLSLTLAGCGDREDASIFSAVGSYGDVAVFASSPALRQAADPILARLNPQRTFVLDEEDTYRFADYAGKTWKDGRNYRNLLFLVRWGDGGPVERELASLLSDDALERSRGGRGGWFVLHNPYFRNQLALVVAAPDPNAVLRTLTRGADAMGDTLSTDIMRRIRHDHRREGLREEDRRRLYNDLAWSVEVPATYDRNDRSGRPRNGVEWLRSADNGLTRGLTVTWREHRDPDAALRDRDLLLAARRDLGRDFHAERLVSESLEWGEEALAGLPAVRLRGAWASEEVSVGGPFECFFVADQQRGRLFCLDLLVYGPGSEKMDDFRRLRAIAETFTLQQPEF